MISVAYSSFFKELEENNVKEWFHANKKRYENHVKTPFIELLDELIPTLTEWDNRIIPDPKKALFRIHKDVRFSKDKSPYHLIMKAGFSPNGKKSILPGYYLGIDTENIHVGGGLFMLQSPDLKKVREYISSHTDAFLKIISNTYFKSAFGQLSGEKAKRIDKTLLSVANTTNLIYNKQFYAMAEFPLETFYQSDKLAEEILCHFKHIKPLNTYLSKALQ